MSIVAERKISSTVTGERHTRNINIGRGDILVIHRKGNTEEARKLAGEILSASKNRTTGANSRVMLEEARNERG